MIERDIAPLLVRLAAAYPVVTLTGPRQSGKTTLARSAFPHLPYLTLEDPDQRRFAAEDPRGFLDAIAASGAVIDEIQRAPQLPSYLQGQVDANARPGGFVLTGSQQFELMTQVSQSLAGRTALLRLLPFTLAEAVCAGPGLAFASLPQTLLGGFYPRIHDRGLDPSQALGDYFATYVERDLRQLASRWNQGESAPLHFHRDATGHEIDLLLPVGRRWHGIEIKAGSTVQPDYFNGLTAFDRSFPDALASANVVYGGDRAEARSRWPVVPWRRLARR